MSTVVEEEVSFSAVTLFGPEDLRLVQVKAKPLAASDVRIVPRATGLCGTDLHYYHDGRNGPYVVDTPLVLGHEFAGEVVKVGSQVKGIEIGDRVVVEPQRPCRTCDVCRRGRYNLCPTLVFTGSATANPPIQGSLQEFYDHPADLVYRLPKSLSFAEGAMIEPLSVALHAVRRSGLQCGSRILIFGAGAIGLLCASIARIAGAASIVMADTEASRLEFAKQNRLTDLVLDMSTDTPPATDQNLIVQKSTELQNQPGFELVDVVFECTGVPVCANVGLYCAAPGAKLVAVGLGAAVQSLHLAQAAKKEVDILPIWRYANTFADAIELVRSGKVLLQPLITHTFDFPRVSEAFEFACKKPPGLIKCVILNREVETAIYHHVKAE